MPRGNIASSFSAGLLASVLVTACSTPAGPSSPAGVSTGAAQELRVGDVGGGGSTGCFDPLPDDCIAGTVVLTAGGGSISGTYRAPLSNNLQLTTVGGPGGNEFLNGSGRFQGITGAGGAQILEVGLVAGSDTTRVRLLFYLPPSDQEFLVSGELAQVYRLAPDASCRHGLREFYTLTGTIPQLGKSNIVLSQCKPSAP